MTGLIHGASVILLLASGVAQRASASAPNTTTTAAACSTPEYRQLDFWAGDWDVFEAGKSAAVAHVRVDRILDGCALHEQYEDTDGKRGQSFSIYDASRKRWHQTWVTNKGELLVIEGTRQGDTVVLSGATEQPGGKMKHVRGIWKPVPEGVRETAWTSLDDGKSWQQWFDLLFRAHTK